MSQYRPFFLKEKKLRGLVDPTFGLCPHEDQFPLLHLPFISIWLLLAWSWVSSVIWSQKRGVQVQDLALWCSFPGCLWATHLPFWNLSSFTSRMEILEPQLWRFRNHFFSIFWLFSLFPMCQCHLLMKFLHLKKYNLFLFKLSVLFTSCLRSFCPPQCSPVFTPKSFTVAPPAICGLAFSSFSYPRPAEVWKY